MLLVMSMSSSTTLHFLPLLSIALIIFDKGHAHASSATHNSLVLSLTHYSTASHVHFPTTPKTAPKKTSKIQDDHHPVLKEIRDGYTMSLTFGTPPQVIQNINFNTGSELVWVPCTHFFECINCDDNYKYDKSSIFSPRSSSSLERHSCTNPLCVDLHSSKNSFDTCTMAGCSLSTQVSSTCTRPCPSFSYTYRGGIVSGILARDILRDNNFNINPNNISFGCVSATYNEPYGIAGFGKGQLSLTSQLGLLDTGFSHCFLPFEFSGNPNISTPLILGGLAISSKENFQFTPMLNNTMYPNLYYIRLEAVTVGDLPTIQAPLNLTEFEPSSGNGGMMIDSGTTYTHITEPLYSQIISNLKSKIKYSRATNMEDQTGFDLCYNMPTNINLTIPSITFHFSNNVSLTLPQKTCFYKMAPPNNSTQLQCLLFRSMDGADNNGPAAILGSFQQQNVEVVYDLKNQRIGFQPTDCVSKAKSQRLQRT